MNLEEENSRLREKLKTGLEYIRIDTGIADFYVGQKFVKDKIQYKIVKECHGSRSSNRSYMAREII